MDERKVRGGEEFLSRIMAIGSILLRNKTGDDINESYFLFCIFVGSH